jgi:hypothetical protein
MIFVAIIWIICIVAITYFWMRNLGVARALIAGICRAGWTVPIILSLFPETVTKRIPGTVALQPVHILVDDSDSMGQRDVRQGTAKAQVKDLLRRIDDVCLQFGCMPKVTPLSELAGDTKKGFTPLSRVIEPWLYKTGGEPWILLSDGGDFRPSINWDERLKERGGEVSSRRPKEVSDPSKQRKTLGLVAAFGSPRVPGFSVESVAMAPLAFEGKNIQLSAFIERVPEEASSASRVQVQVLVDGRVTTSGEVDFAAGASSGGVDMTFAAPKRGPHIVTVKALAVAGELDTWDNIQTRVLDVIPNTVGVLHLLGSPAWDGRFMRRFLKAEPKFDVISFFILRDPWDSQNASERELSLIPFPVERLFTEELVNFRVIVMQNFTLMRFLQPEYQKNLANFVRNGGGILFIGGPRALTDADASNSALLNDLLPFEMKPGSQPVENAGNGDDVTAGMGSSWDAENHFKVELASPDAPKRALASIYESWQAVAPRLTSLTNMKGLHRMESIKFRDKEITPLLNARLKDGRVVPLAVASYPGKGRALWLFSDSFWRAAMSSNPENSRSDYHSFMDSALSWLTGGDLRQTITVRDFKVSQVGDQADKIKWQAVFSGSAARYIKSSSSLRISVCGIGAAVEGLSFGGASGDSVEVEGEINTSLRDGMLCGLKMDVEHPSFGSLSVAGWAMIPETLADASMGPSPAKLRQLAKLTGATFVGATDERARNIEQWLQLLGASDGKALPDKMKSTREFYWPQDYSWLWVLFLLLPAEILVRRWHLIAGRKA